MERRIEAPVLLTMREAADVLGVSDETIRRRVHDGTLSSVRLGWTIRVPASEVVRVLGRTMVIRRGDELVRLHPLQFEEIEREA